MGTHEVSVAKNWGELRRQGKNCNYTRCYGDGRKGRWGAQTVCVDCGQWGKEAHAWPQLPLRKLSRQLSRTYSSSAPNTQRPAFTTLGNFLCCFTVVTSLQLACTAALLGRGTATCHNPKAWRQGEREFKDLYSSQRGSQCVYTFQKGKKQVALACKRKYGRAGK